MILITLMAGWGVIWMHWSQELAMNGNCCAFYDASNGISDIIGRQRR